MCEYATAEEGYIWKLTDSGKAVGRIAAKFIDSSSHSLRYALKVPKKWVEEGYVKQVKR